MRKTIVVISAAFVLLAAVFIIGYGALQVQAQPRFAPTPTPAPGVSVNPKATLPVSSSIDVSSVASPRVLVWNPNKGQLAWINASNSVKLADGFTNKALVVPCKLSPTGDRLVVFLGGDKSKEVMYPLDSGATAPIGDTVGLSCLIPHHTQFSPDGARIGVILYDNKATQGEYAVGKLTVLKSPEATQVYSQDSVVSLDLQNDGALALQFFANTKGDVSAAVLLWWDGQKEHTLDSNIVPEQNCNFVAGRSIRVADKAYTLLGESCKQPTGSKWYLISTNMAGGGTASVSGGPSGGKYFSSANTNDIWVLPTGKDLLFSVPEGLSNESVNLARISLADGSVSNVLPRVIMDTYPPNPTWIGKRFAFSPKGDRLALTTRDNNGGEQLYIYDTTNPGSAPVSIAGGDKIDRINGVAWTADGSALFYIVAGQTNGVGYYAVSGDKKLLARTNGQYISMGINPDGSAVAVTEQYVPNKSNPGDVRYNLVLIGVADQTKTTIVEGAKGEAPLAPFWVR